MRARRLVSAAGLFAAGLLAVGTQSIQAQSGGATSPPLPPIQAPSAAAPGGSGQRSPAESQLPPYEPQLDRLAELMGALAYLRDLCGKGDSQDWRGRMNALLEAEATTPTRKERLAGAYNTGFRGYEITYRVCTPSAELIILRFLAEGDRLARDLSTRFGGG